MSEDGQASQAMSWQHVYALPKFPSPVVGRETEIAEMRGRLGDGVRLLTLAGEAGIGKTRLAVEIANLLAGDRRPARFLRLAPFRDGAVLPGLIASVCAIDGWPDLPIARLPATLDAVLVFDGFDHMQDAGTIVSALLERCPNVVAIVTSRDPLQLPGEHVISIGPFSSHAATRLLERFGVVPEENDVIDRLVAGTGGNPLAIELAGAHLRAGIIQPFLERPPAPWPLGDTIAWCIAALPDEERTLLLRLSVMAAGFGAGAAVALAQISPSIGGSSAAHLDSLVRLGLVSSMGLASGERRFEIPAVVREIALAQLNESGELSTVRLAYARHMLDRAAAMRDPLHGRHRDAALAWFETEQAGLRLAFGTFVQLRRSYLARRMALALWPWWVLRRNYRVGRRWLKLALELFDPAAPDDLEQELLVASGLLELYGGNRPAARSRSATGAKPGLSGGDDDWRGASLATLGLLAAFENDHDRAIGLYRIFLESTEPRKASNSWLPQLRTVIRLALSAAEYARGEFGEAEYHANLALKDALRFGDPMLVAYARIHLAAVATATDQLLLALDMYRDSIPLLLERPHAGAVSTGLLGVAELAFKIENYVTVARLLGTARQLLEAGAPPPPHLVRFDPDAILAALQQLPRRQAPKAEDVPPLDNIAEIDRITHQALADLSARLTPASTGSGLHGAPDLTNRELEVLCLMTQDMSAREIADALFVGTRTAEQHVGNIIGKLGVKSRVGAVAHALREGWCS